MEEIILETNNFKTIDETCKDALVYHKMVGVIGSTGLGKTTAIIKFKEKLPENVVVVTVSSSMTAKVFYSSILNTYGDSSFRSSDQLYFIIQKAINVFKSNNENKLLIIDEAGRLTPRMLEYLHEFRDSTLNNTGIVLSGVNYFLKNLKKWNDSELVGIPEFFSRISDWQTLEKPNKEEIIAVIHANDITDEDFIKACLNVPNFRELKKKIDIYKNFNKNKS